ncbi:hypothetical protein [Asticcacaulis solisilvae]|uniref:hypothetical protein n=1 Tax=Asticcacaulis solisilvae TaxID=1217274 RepID=UPI003FD8252C
MTSSPRSPALPALYVAVGGLLVLAAGLGVATLTGRFDPAAAIRYFGILMGLLMLVSGNALPKLVQPRAAGARAARVAGWLLVLGGLGIVGLWIWTPQASRILVTSVTGLVVFVLVLVIALIMTAGMGRADKDAAGSPEMRRAAVHRSLLFHILHGVMWAFAFLLAGALGYGRDVPWLVAIFTASMGVLDLCVATRRRKARTA